MIDGRWMKLRKEFYDSEKERYNISKIPDIYDTIRHDLRKNSLIFNKIDQEILDRLHDTAKLFAHFVVIN
jgi:inositol hexakisphosphate/diphosphoinositol-pentakisphosphate kinase